ncbi:MAG: hypothetical protein A4E52_02084 [Pelotomaculum sp. PtaB.Bin013]|uniref:PsbP C-terminal domain-containing protein n=1 Tax=Pelotomaculum isophthalicicum JI TaxID=947010 RepID=A0A9X4JTB3_9FIRM|nr:PsbP-related protein [Pelotomaculum isophthalicicum]MDF9407195.1 hypothetical protein [Pelotomaculum isophthalicicum JI]OPX82228.1 MAG: hypothetical protein A4E52_02084 [Pelotomaculum sp. PtaB.Bin013]
MKIRVFPLILIVVLFILTGCNNSNRQQDWKTYSGKGFSFSYPGNWHIGNTEKLGLQKELSPEVIIYAPTKPGEIGAGINLTIQQTPLLAPSAKELADQTVTLFTSSGNANGIKEYKKISFRPVKYGNTDAGILTGEMTAAQNNVTVKSNQLIIPNGFKYFTLTASCKKDEWETYEPEFDKIIESFKITE